MLSTLLLVILGLAQPTIQLTIACALVVGGAWIATRRGEQEVLEEMRAET